MKIGIYTHRHGLDLVSAPDDFPVGYYSDADFADGMDGETLELVRTVVDFESKRGETLEVVEFEGGVMLDHVTLIEGPAGSLKMTNLQAITLGMTAARHHLEFGIEDDMNGGDLVEAFNEMVEQCATDIERKDSVEDDDDEDGEEQEPGEDD